MEPSSPVLAAQGEPVLAEVLMSPSLFRSFMMFMKNEMAHENVLFLKEAQLFSYMRRPPAEMHKEACRIFFTFICEGAKIAVNVGSETKQAISDTLWNRKDISPHLFDNACLEIRNLIMPKFLEWINFKEWTQQPYHRLTPPSFVQVLHIPQLVTSLCDFIKKQDSDSLIFEQFKTTDGVAEEHPPAGNLEDLDLSLRSSEEKCSMLHFCEAVTQLTDPLGEKGVPDDEAARHLWNQYRKKVPIKHKKGQHYGPFIKQWLQWLISEFSDSTVFGDWIDQRIWVSEVAYECRPSQTLDENGYQVFPTLAAIISNKELNHVICGVFGDSEVSKSIRFLNDICKFAEKYSKALVLDKNAATTAETVTKQMTLDAKDLFRTYIGTEGGSDANIAAQQRSSSSSPAGPTSSYDDMGESLGSADAASPMKLSAVARRQSLLGLKGQVILDKKLKTELKTSLFSRFSRRVTYDMFSRCGAYVYHRCQSTWFRDLQHTYVWSCMEYDNNSPACQAIEHLFNLSSIRDVPISVPPVMDDILANSQLLESFVRSVYKNESERVTLTAFLEESEKVLASCPPEQVASETRRLVDLIAVLRLNSNVEVPLRFIHDSLAVRKEASPYVLRFIRSLVFESVLSLGYNNWIRLGSFSQIEWTPCSPLQRAETNCVTFLLESLVDPAHPAVDCVTLYGRPMLSGGRRPVVQRTQSSFRIVDSNSGSISGEPSTADASSANSSSSDSVMNSVTSEIGNYPMSTGSSGDLIPIDVPPLSIPSRRPKTLSNSNPIAATAETIVTPHPRVSDIISYMPRVPTLDETLDSTLLRGMFEDYFLLPRLTDENDRQLWKSLRDFSAAFTKMTDEEFTSKQPELRAQAQHILDQYPSYLRKQPFLKSRLASNCVVTSRFFREEEIFLYGKAHQSYESLLEKSGWLKL